MSSQQPKADLERTLSVEVSNIGGIDYREVDIPPGVTVLQGENATNRSSFLQAIMAGLGSNRATLRGDAQEGSVTITSNGDSQTRTLTRTGETVSFGGEPLLDDTVQADLYSFLLADNEIRQTVEQDGNLYDVLMRPVDTDKIEARINSLQTEQQRVETQLDEAKAAADELPGLEEDKNKLQNQRDELEEKIKSLNDEIDQLEKQSQEGDTQEEINELTEELNDKQRELNSVTERIQNLDTRLETAIERLESLDAPDRDEDAIKAEIQDLQDDRDTIQRQIEDYEELDHRLTNAIEINQEILNTELDISSVVQQMPTDVELPDGPLAQKASPEDPTEQLVKGQHVMCQVCGSEVNADKIREITSQYREFRNELQNEKDELKAESENLTQEIKSLQSTLNEFDRIRSERDDLKSNIDQFESELESLREQRDGLEDEVDEIQAELESMDTGSHDDELVEKRTERNTAERDKSDVESQLNEVTSEIKKKENQAAERDSLPDQLDEIRNELEELRGTVEQREKELVEKFNAEMETVLDLLQYENIGRIWIDRKVKSKSRGETETEFDLIITREGENGAYEDQLSHLSESERTVTGLVVALTGYLVHDVHESCPVMLLDSVEMIDSDRIGAILDYFGAYPDYLIAALLPEDTARIENDEINIIDW
jgi:DNA repair exonuclease SbcCD ATPase subunit